MGGFRPQLLWTPPEINPVNKKARSIPALNPIDQYGRVFTFSWFGFLVAFWSWYAFPPLLHDIIARDLGISSIQVANSNIVSLCATLVVRLIAGPACDRFGPRITFAGCLLAGAVPTFLCGAVFNVQGLYAIRFFIGILGGSFVPCQVWTTAFYDKNVVGTANALTGGLGNLGGGVTYFIMPAVYNSLVKDGLSPHNAWRVAFVVPGIVITSTAIAMLLFAPDTPTGKWADRQTATEDNIRNTSIAGQSPDTPRLSTEATKPLTPSSDEKGEKEKGYDPAANADPETAVGQQVVLETARGEIIQKPTLSEIARVCFSPQTLVCAAAYFNTFGAELAVNSILGQYYARNFPQLNLQEQGNWAAMFGLLNGVTRPLGGFLSDFVYRASGSVWAKKMAIHTYAIIAGAFLIAIGVLDSRDQATMFGLIAGFAFFLEGANGLVFGLVPHVHPYANGVVSGFTGASGNLGGIVFAIIFRYVGTRGKSFWIIGVIGISMNLAVSWIRPIPRGQVGGR